MYNENDYKPEGDRVIVTVIGRDKVGIIAGVSGILAENKANIMDISQTTLRDEFFTMIMLVDIGLCSIDLKTLKDKLALTGEKLSVKIEVQHEDVFKYMHRI